MEKSGSTPSFGLKRTGGAPREGPSAAPSKRGGNLKTSANLKQQVLRYDVYVLSPREWLTYGLAGILFCGLVSYEFYRSLIVFLVIFPVGMFYPIYKKRELAVRRLSKLSLEFKEAILLLSSALSAGYSVENALSVTARELKDMYGESGMMTIEFQFFQRQSELNVPVEKVFMDFAARCGLEDVRNFAEVFVSAKRSGGDLVSIINHTADIIRGKVQVQEDIAAMTSSRQYEQKIMNLIPFLIMFYLDLTSPGYFDVMYQTTAGRAVMTVCLAVYLISCAAAKKLLDIRV